MLKEKEYLGFAMKRPEEDGAIVYVFQVLPEGIRCFGGYRMMGVTEKRINPSEATVITVTFTDGTTPINIEEFDKKLQKGEAEEGDMYIKVNVIGVTKYDEGKRPLYEILEEFGDKAYFSIFNQCLASLKRRQKFGEERNRTMKWANALYDKYLDNLKNSFADSRTYENYKHLIVDLLDEAKKTVDSDMVRFIIKKYDELKNSDVPDKKIASKIARAVKSKYEAIAKKEES